MTTHNARTLTATALAAPCLLLLAACSSGSSPSTHITAAGVHTTGHAISNSASPPRATASVVAAGSADACGLVTEQQLTTVLGSDPGPGTSTADDSTASCVYGGAVSIVIDHAGGRVQFDQFCSTSQPQPNIHNASGVGDGACYEIVGGPIAAMYILKGTVVTSINIQAGLDTKVTPAALIALGKSAASRL